MGTEYTKRNPSRTRGDTCMKRNKEVFGIEIGGSGRHA
jgi:hypothetical protein